MEKVNQKLAVFMVPNGQGGFRQESYSLRKDVGGGGTGPSYSYPQFGAEAWRFERKVTKNTRRNRDLIFPPTTVLDDLDSYFMDWQND